MTKVAFQLPNYPDTIIEVSRSYWTGRIFVWVNGQPAEKEGGLSRAFLIPLPDGVTKKLEVDRGGFDYIPRVYVDGNRIEIGRKLKWYELILGGLPLLMVFGGALGGLCGAIAFTVNFRVLRSDKKAIYKGLTIAGVTALSVIIYFVLAFIFGLLIKG
jgi:hypothetical protein